MSRKESSIFFSFLFHLLIFLFTSEIQARKVLQQNCSSSCGDIKNITHPFRLKGDPAGCGYPYPEFELSCQSNKTIIEYDSGKYYVKRISYDEQTIRVVDINLANGSCGLPYKSSLPHKSSLPYKFWSIFDRKKYYYIYNNNSFASFMNCSRNVTDQAYTRVPCLSVNDQSNVYIKYGSHKVSDLPESCSFISMVPIHNLSVDYPSYESIRNSMELGVDLNWGVDVFSNTVQVFQFILRILWIVMDLRGNILLGPPEVVSTFIFAPVVAEYLFYALVVLKFISAPVVLLVFLIHKYIKTLERVDNVEKFLHNQQSWIPKRYSYPEIIAMTNHFTHKLGQGGFGSVYTGQLYSGSLIAVKMLENSKFSAEEFINEVSTIGRIHHLNVVQLLGFCAEGSKRALVYEYMPNGSLDRHIFPKEGRGQSFSWEKLHEIALGTARGIEYLHGGCDVCILHFDIKPHNILLDHNFIPKVSDFGLAKFYPKENDFVSSCAMRGTIGYIAPELISRNFGTVSCKSDVYSYGMLLLEMVGGRRNSNMNATRSSKAYFPSWVYDQINKGGDLELRNVTEMESVIARKLSLIGLWCIQVKAADRPSMTKVLEMLGGSIHDLQMPPKPFFSSSRHMSEREIESYSSMEFLESQSIEECSISDSYV